MQAQLAHILVMKLSNTTPIHAAQSDEHCPLFGLDQTQFCIRGYLTELCEQGSGICAQLNSFKLSTHSEHLHHHALIEDVAVDILERVQLNFFPVCLFLLPEHSCVFIFLNLPMTYIRRRSIK